MTADRELLIREARPEDLAAINEIYNHYVLTSTCTYQKDPDTLADRQAWFAHHGPMHPVTVSVCRGEICGWGSLSDFRQRWGYRYTAEHSVYVHERWHRQGIGRALLADLIERAHALKYHMLIAGISAEQTASIALHAALGFTTVGRLEEVGHKFDQWLDVVFMQRRL
jgi:phosphinothricin acetyltransferase